jgi:hypothetical protein
MFTTLKKILFKLPFNIFVGGVAYGFLSFFIKIPFNKGIVFCDNEKLSVFQYICLPNQENLFKASIYLILLGVTGSIIKFGFLCLNKLIFKKIIFSEDNPILQKIEEKKEEVQPSLLSSEEKGVVHVERSVKKGMDSVSMKKEVQSLIKNEHTPLCLKRPKNIKIKEEAQMSLQSLKSTNFVEETPFIKSALDEVFSNIDDISIVTTLWWLTDRMKKRKYIDRYKDEPLHPDVAQKFLDFEFLGIEDSNITRSLLNHKKIYYRIN